jgi:hypothetical protein
MSEFENSRLIELGPITDFYVDGLGKMELLGENVRMIYFRWRFFDGCWQKIAVEFARVCPITSLMMPIERYPAVAIARPEPANLHS